jgi:hypothetical protein
MAEKEFNQLILKAKDILKENKFEEYTLIVTRTKGSCRIKIISVEDKKEFFLSNGRTKVEAANNLLKTIREKYGV